MPAPSTSSCRVDLLRRCPALFTLVAAVVLALVLLGSGAASSSAQPIAAPYGPGAPPGASPAGGTAEVGEERDDEAPGTEVFATVDDLELRSPSDDARVHGFHEATSSGSAAMTPVGGHPVLPSRGRGQPATSAVDIVLVDDDPVLSPVDGTVVAADRYELYGRHGDLRLVIEPDDAPDLQVVLLHVRGLQVEVGDAVAAGETTLAAGSRRLPFSSQVDRETAPDAWPHVHLEVERA